jgi:hypothetical protein
MSVFPIKTIPGVFQAQAPPQGELVAATPLGKDADGKNLVAYIIRTDEEADIRARVLQNANSNNPNLKKQGVTQEPPPQPRAKSGTAARFIKPDIFLSQLEKEQLQQLRLRDANIREEADALDNGDSHSLITAFVYDKGPDGRRYAVGVAAPLIAQKQSTENKAPPPLPSGQLNPYIQASLAYRHSSEQDATGPKAGLLDRAL